MPPTRAFSETRLVNGSTGDPSLYIDYPGLNNALLFDAGENFRLDNERLGDLEAVFLTHHHVDHFIGFDRIMRANIDKDKTLHVFGPDGTIRKVYDRIKSYEYQYFPFQKIAVKVTELLPGLMRTALLECTKKFPEPEISEHSCSGRVIYQNADLHIEAVPVEHTVSCWAFALVEATGYHPDPSKLESGVLRSGPWVPEALRLLREGADPKTTLEVGGGSFTLAKLAEDYFSISPGARVAYVTDTLWAESIRSNLVQLAKGAWRLYCDSYYSIAQQKQANTHKHMTATHAAELAKLAKVDQLVLMHFAPRYVGKYESLIEEAKAIFPKVTAELG
jgi:ribonuclease Z